MAGGAFESILRSVRLAVFLTKGNVAILAAGLKTFGALHQVELDHHAKRALEVLRKTVEQVLAVKVCEGELHLIDFIKHI